MITTTLGIIGAILLAIIILRGYFLIGMFLGSFAVDAPSTPVIVGYLVAVFWPVFLVGLIIGSILWGIAKFLCKFFFALFLGLYIEQDVSGKWIIRKLKDAVYIKYSYGTYMEFKSDIEENLEHLSSNFKEDPKYWLEDPVGQFYIDLMKYSNDRVTEEEMFAKHSKTCPNLKKVLKFNWNIKNVPGL